jgi:hypothetical protein
MPFLCKGRCGVELSTPRSIAPPAAQRRCGKDDTGDGTAPAWALDDGQHMIDSTTVRGHLRSPTEKGGVCERFWLITSRGGFTRKIHADYDSLRLLIGFIIVTKERIYGRLRRKGIFRCCFGIGCMNLSGLLFGAFLSMATNAGCNLITTSSSFARLTLRKMTSPSSAIP